MRKKSMLVFVVAALVACMGAVSAGAAPAHAYPTTASYYGFELAGSPMANGAPFAPYAYTAAHKYLPLGSVVTVCHRGCVTVTITDRGPYVAGREYDLSLGAAEAIGLTHDGVGHVEVYPVRT